PAAAARSTNLARVYAVAGGGWPGDRGSALPPDRAIGSTSNRSTRASAAGALERGEAHSSGNTHLRSSSPVARRVLSARSCGTVHAAATRRAVSALLRCGSGQREWLVRPCLGTRRRCRRHRRRDRLSLRSAGGISVSGLRKAF